MYSHITYEKVPLITFGFIGLSTIVLAAMIFRDTKQEQSQEPEPTQQPEPEQSYEEEQQTQGGKRKTKRNKAKHNRKTKRR